MSRVKVAVPPGRMAGPPGEFSITDKAGANVVIVAALAVEVDATVSDEGGRARADRHDVLGR